jgi:protein FRA10AC1
LLFHRFLRDDEDAPGESSSHAALTTTTTTTTFNEADDRNTTSGNNTSSWNDQLAAKYYASLYREFALCDLKHYKSGNVSHPKNNILYFILFL